MKLYKIKCIKDPKASDADIVGLEELVVKFEDSYEDGCYEDANDDTKDYMERWQDFNTWLDGTLGVIDNDVYMYFMSSEKDYEIGDTYTDADGFVWERVE